MSGASMKLSFNLSWSAPEPHDGRARHGGAIEVAEDFMRLTAPFIGAMLFSGTLCAWQLASKTLADRVSDADVIVVGSLGTIHSRARRR